MIGPLYLHWQITSIIKQSLESCFSPPVTIHKKQACSFSRGDVTVLTISQLAEKFDLSRSTLIYYDKIGILKPSARSESNYRIYTEADIKTLELICAYRNTGMALKEIKKILQAKDKGITALLEKRLIALNAEIQSLRKQQQHIMGMLKTSGFKKKTRTMDKAQWVEILKFSGMDEDDMWKWHSEFERLSPESHQDFLESLNIDENEIRAIRERSRKAI